MDKQKILVVDDEKKVVELLQETIKKIGDGYAVKTAYNGKEAMDILEKEKFDLVLLDIKMPVMSGVQVLTELHNRKIWLPVIILTAYTVKDIEDKFREFGIIDYLSKPLDLIQLKKKIEEVMRNREQKDSISGMSLAAILQVLEMEQRTGIISIKTDDRTGRIFFKEGRVVDIEAEGLSVEEALGYLLDYTNKSKEISIEYLNHKRTERINKSLTEILLEASRLLDEDKNKKSKEIEQSEQIVEKEAQIDTQKLNKIIEALKDDLGEALLSTEIWTVSDGKVVAGHNPQESVCDLFTQITFYVNEALSTSEYPQLGKYFLLNLKGGKLFLTIPVGDYAWGILIDSKKTPLGFLLKVILSKSISSFEEAIAAGN